MPLPTGGLNNLGAISKGQAIAYTYYHTASGDKVPVFYLAPASGITFMARQDPHALRDDAGNDLLFINDNYELIKVRESKNTSASDIRSNASTWAAAAAGLGAVGAYALASHNSKKHEPENNGHADPAHTPNDEETKKAWWKGPVKVFSVALGLLSVGAIADKLLNEEKLAKNVIKMFRGG